MKEEKIEYKNWVPKSFIYYFLITESILVVFALIPFQIIINIILWICSGIVMFFGILCINAYHQFGKDNNKIQHEVHEAVESV